MTEQTSDKPAPRGDAAYRAQKDAINARNDAARKAGKEFRQSEDKKAIERQRKVDRDDMTGLRDKFGAS